MKRLDRTSAVLDDRDLIERLNRGDREAFTHLYGKYAGQVYGYLRTLMGDEAEAEDLTQYCFMQMWIHKEKIQCKGNLPAWLYVMARNTAYNEIKRKLTADRYVRQMGEEASDCIQEDDGKVDLKMMEEEMKKVVEGLPESRKKIYLMSRTEGKSSAAIAEELGISVKTVEAQISRVRIALRNAISKIIVCSILMGVNIF